MKQLLVNSLVQLGQPNDTAGAKLGIFSRKWIDDGYKEVIKALIAEDFGLQSATDLDLFDMMFVYGCYPTYNGTQIKVTGGWAYISANATTGALSSFSGELVKINPLSLTNFSILTQDIYLEPSGFVGSFNTGQADPIVFKNQSIQNVNAHRDVSATMSVISTSVGGFYCFGFTNIIKSRANVVRSSNNYFTSLRKYTILELQGNNINCSNNMVLYVDGGTQAATLSFGVDVDLVFRRNVEVIIFVQSSASITVACFTPNTLLSDSRKYSGAIPVGGNFTIKITTVQREKLGFTGIYDALIQVF